MLGWNSSSVMIYHVYVWCSVCVRILLVHSTNIWSHRARDDCISLHIMWKNPVQIGSVMRPHMQSGFIKSDQTWRNSLVPWLPPRSNHLLPVIPPFLDWISSVCNNVTRKRRPQETVSVKTVTAGWHNSSRTGRKVASVFDEAACTQTYSVAVFTGTHVPRQTYSVCVCVFAQSLKLCPNSVLQTNPTKCWSYSILFLLVHSTWMYLTVLYWQEMIKVHRRQTKKTAVKRA